MRTEIGMKILRLMLMREDRYGQGADILAHQAAGISRSSQHGGGGTFGALPSELVAALEILEAHGLVRRDGDKWRLTGTGRDMALTADVMGS